jgi:GNAT superfamily N-acetyltransferase
LQRKKDTKPIYQGANLSKMASTTYRVVTIPKLDERTTKDDHLALAHKFRNFRLLALKTAPGAFASSYDEEARHGLDHTFERLRHAKATHFVALASETSRLDLNHVHEADLNELLGLEWLGYIVLIGPEECLGTVSAKANPFGHVKDNTRESVPEIKSSKEDVLRFHLNGMFVCPSGRRRGMGVRLIEAALDAARTVGLTDDRGYHCTIIVDEWNLAARKLYERVGFNVVARETYGEDRPALHMAVHRVGEAAGGNAACEIKKLGGAPLRQW